LRLAPLRLPPKIGYDKPIEAVSAPQREPHVPQDAHQTLTMNAGSFAPRPSARALQKLLLLINP
jgi:hypothetical protein